MQRQGLISNVGLWRTAILIWVIPNQHFQSTLLGGGHKKRVRCVRSWKWWQLWTTPYRVKCFREKSSRCWKEEICQRTGDTLSLRSLLVRDSALDIAGIWKQASMFGLDQCTILVNFTTTTTASQRKIHLGHFLSQCLPCILLCLNGNLGKSY